MDGLSLGAPNSAEIRSKHGKKRSQNAAPMTYDNKTSSIEQQHEAAAMIPLEQQDAGGGYWIDLEQFGVVEGAQEVAIIDDHERGAEQRLAMGLSSGESAVQGGGRSQSWEINYGAQSALSSGPVANYANYEGGEILSAQPAILTQQESSLQVQSLAQAQGQGQGQQSRAQVQGQGQSADGLGGFIHGNQQAISAIALASATSLDLQQAAPIQQLPVQNLHQQQVKVRVNELGQLGTIKNLNKIISSQQNYPAGGINAQATPDQQESLEILQHVKKIAEIPARSLGGLVQTCQTLGAKRGDTLDSHKLFKKQKMNQMLKQEGAVGKGVVGDKFQIQKVLNHIDHSGGAGGHLYKQKASKSMSGLPLAKKNQKVLKTTGQRANLMKQTIGGKSTEAQNCGVGGSRNTISLVGKKSAMAQPPPAASSTEKLSQTLGPDSFVDLFKNSNQSFNYKINVKSQQRTETSNNKIDKIIRKNLRKQKEKDDQKKKEEDAKTMRDIERKQQIQMRNEWVRKLHKQQYQRSRQRRNSNTFTAAPLAAVTTSLSLKKKVAKAPLAPGGLAQQKHQLNLTKTSDTTLIELSGVGPEQRSRREDLTTAKVKSQLPRSELQYNRKSHSIQKYGPKAPKYAGNNSPRRVQGDVANTQSSQEQVRDSRKAQRPSQERGNQRVLSGMSRGSRSRSGKSGFSAKSGRSVGLSGPPTYDATSGKHFQNHQMHPISEQRGQIMATQISAHAGGKKHSINSNISQLNQQNSSNPQKPSYFKKQSKLTNFQQQQQSVQDMSIHQGGGIISNSQQLDTNTILQRQARERRDNDVGNRESPFLGDPSSLPFMNEDMDLRNLEEQVNQISYNNTKNNISQILHGEHSLEDEILPDNYFAQLEETTDFKRLNSQKDLSKTQKQLLLQGQTSKGVNETSLNNGQKGNLNKDGLLGSQHTQTHSHDKLTFKSKKGNGLYKHGGSVATGALGLQGLPSSSSNLLFIKQASQNLQKTLNASSLLMAGGAASSSNNIGMDFLDVKKEILDELKQVDRKAQEKYAKTQRRRKHQLSHKDIMVVNGRLTAGQDLEGQLDFQRTAMIQDSSVQDLRVHHDGQLISQQLPEDLSQHEFNNNDINSSSQNFAKLRSKSSSPIIQRLENEQKKNSRNAQQKFLDGPAGISKQSGTQVPSGTVQRLYPQKTLTTVNPQHSLFLKQQLQKFIKRKQKDKKQMEEQVKMEQINVALRVHENLSKLEQFVQKQAAATNNKTVGIPVSSIQKQEKKTSLERSRSGRRPRSKSRDRKNMPQKKNNPKLQKYTDDQVAAAAGKASRLSHQNLITGQALNGKLVDQDNQMTSIHKTNTTNNDDILRHAQSNQVLNVNAKVDSVSFFRSDGKRISKSQSRDRMARMQHQNNDSSLQNLQPIFSNQNIFEHDTHLSDKHGFKDGSSKNPSQFNSKTIIAASSNRTGTHSGKLTKKRHKSTNRDHQQLRRLKPYTCKDMGRALAKSLSLQNKHANGHRVKDQRLQQNLLKNNLSKKSLHFDSPYSKAQRNASSSKSKSRSRSKKQSKQSKTKSKSPQSKTNSKQSKSHSRSRKAAKRQIGIDGQPGQHALQNQRPPKPKKSTRVQATKPTSKTQKLDLPKVKLQDDQLIEILKKINYDFSKPKGHKKRKKQPALQDEQRVNKGTNMINQQKLPSQKIQTSSFEQNKALTSTVQPKISNETVGDRIIQQQKQMIQQIAPPQPPPAALLKEKQIKKYREERWVVPSFPQQQSLSQGPVKSHMYSAEKNTVGSRVGITYKQGNGEESSKEQSLLLQNSRSQQSFTFCDRQSSTFKGLGGAHAPVDAAEQESHSNKRSLVDNSLNCDRGAEQVFQVRNLEMNASSASSINGLNNKLVILDKSRPKIQNNYMHQEDSYASCMSGSHSVRSTRSGILAKLKDKNLGVPSVPHLQTDGYQATFLPLQVDSSASQPLHPIAADSH